MHGAYRPVGFSAKRSFDYDYDYDYDYESEGKRRIGETHPETGGGQKHGYCGYQQYGSANIIKMRPRGSDS